MRTDLVRIAQALSRNGLNKGAAGNVSARTGHGFLITPSGIANDKLTPDMMVPMEMDGSWSGEVQPSSEWRFHRDIYANRPDIKAVVHTHSPAATALAVLGRGLPSFHYMVAMAGGCDVRCAAYATYGTQDLSDHALHALDGRLACLLAHHGMIACGPSLDRAHDLAVEIEHLSGIYLSLLPLGEPPRLPQEEMKRVLEKFKGYIK